MKLAEVVPLFKSRERYLETNYRPISLLTTLSKILEKLVCSRVYTFLDKTGQIVSTQYGFQRESFVRTSHKSSYWQQNKEY